MTEYRAEEHLRAIRQLMERATIYRAISAPAALVGGLLSLGTAAGMLAWQAGGPERNVDAVAYLAIWALVFLCTAAANMLFIRRNACRRGDPPVSLGMRLALRSLTPSFLAGAGISACLTLTSEESLLPTLFWLVFYGLGLLSTMNFAPRSIAALGWAFLFTGIGAFIYFMNQTILPDIELPTPTRFYPAAIMGATFGVYHLVYAACTWPYQHADLEAIEQRALVTHEDPPAMILDFERIDKIIHERGRLAIMTLLATRVHWAFADLKAELKLSDGNLVTHLRTLHHAGYVTVTKQIADRPRTNYSLTERGRVAFQNYLAVLEEIVRTGQG